MIEGARNRVSGAPHWDIFRQAEREHPDQITTLADEVRRYAAARIEVNSTAAGSEILAQWPQRDEWNRTFGGNSSKLFGMVVWVTLFDDAQNWRTEQKTVDGRQVRVYQKAESVVTRVAHSE